MEQTFLGSGWAFPITLSETGGIAVSQNDDKIKESIRLILSTAKGERVMLPEFGCDIHDFAFSVINTSTLTMMKTAVKDALVVWEPRIEVIVVEVSIDGLEHGVLYMQVNYRVRTTNAEQNLVYPFFLRPGG
jgi:phage baseplate assembly protein W